MPRRTTLVLALVVVVIAAGLRFYHYFFLEQYLLKLLIAVSIVILACSVLMVLFKTRFQTYKDSLVFAIVVAILFGFTFESAASNRRKNQRYLERLAGIVNRYTQKNHVTPQSVDAALAESGEMLPNRGDADGNPYTYLRIGDRIYVIKTLGANQKNDSGSGDDVQLNYLNGNFVSFEELVSWVQSNGTPEENMSVEAFWPAMRRTH